jgi:uncharacterized protein (UPF0147 family)
VAVSVCSVGDAYSRETGRQIIDLLFDASDNTLRALHLKRNVHSFSYKGDKPRKEVLTPLVQSLEEISNERAVYKNIRLAFADNVTSTSEAADYSEVVGNSAILEAFESLDREERDILKQIDNLEEFDEVFSHWGISAHAVIDSVKKFAAAWRQQNDHKVDSENK